MCISFERERQVCSGADEIGGGTAPARVLIVDPDPTTRLQIQAALQKTGIQVLEADTADAARAVTTAVAEEALKNYEYEEWAELEVAEGRSLKGLFPGRSEQANADYEAWKKAGGKK